MRRNLMLPIVVAGLLLGFAPDARAAIIVWDGGGADDRWDTGDNWTPNGVPTGADDFYIEVNPSTMEIDISNTGGNAAVASTVYLASANPANVTLNMTGGEFNVTSGIIVGRNNRGMVNLSGGVITTGGVTQGQSNSNGDDPIGIINVSGTGTLNVSGDYVVGGGGGSSSAPTAFSELNVFTGGLVTADHLLVGDENNGRGRVTMTGGAVTVGSLMATSNGGSNIRGEFHLDGGALTINDATPASPTLGYPPTGLELGTIGIDNLGTFDISGGTLLLAGDATAAIQNYIDTDLITGNDLLNALNNGLVFDYNVLNAGYTTVRAIPEPSSVALAALALLSLASCRRRRPDTR